MLALGTVFWQDAGRWVLGGRWLGQCWLGLGLGRVLTLLAFLYFNNQVAARVIPWERRFRIPFRGHRGFSPSFSTPLDTEDNLENGNASGLLMGLVKPTRSRPSQPPGCPGRREACLWTARLETGYAMQVCPWQKCFCSRGKETSSVLHFIFHVSCAINTVGLFGDRELIYLVFATLMM